MSEPTTNSDTWDDKIYRIFENLLDDHVDMYSQDRESSAALGDDIETAKAALEQLLLEARKQGQNDSWAITYNFLHYRERELCDVWETEHDLAIITLNDELQAQLNQGNKA